MEKFILGKKLGMTQIFDKSGKVIPVTVIQAGPCVVTQIKTDGMDGYCAVQVGFDEIRKNLVNKPRMGVFKKAKVSPRRHLREFAVSSADGIELGSEIKCGIFAEGDQVDVTSRTKGRGFTGVIKRWNQHRGPMAHGSGYHRGVGSMGAHTEPSRVFKNKHMSGQYGNEQVTIQNLTIVKVDKDKNCLLVKGGIPGPEGVLVSVKNAVKPNIKSAGGGK
jgi:large subunit ribosomal protein L3